MGRLIAVLSLVVVCSFTFVILHLWLRRPAQAGPPPGTPPLLEVREDGSIYAVSIQLEQFERRLMEEEQRTIDLRAKLDVEQEERAAVTQQVEELQGAIRQLRRELERATVPPPVDPSVPPTPESGGTPDGTGLP
jgi:septal ring factor EnvC (AmiA/AmiB activator)